MYKKKKVSRIIRERSKTKRPVSRWSIWATLIFLLAMFLIISGIYLHITADIPKISTLADYNPPVVTTVYSDDNKIIAEFYKEYRIVVPLSKIPPMLKDAFISAEDSRFYKHKGIDIQSIIRAFLKNVEARSIVQGGSTITQQVTKSFLLTPEKSYKRKITEAILAYKIDKTFSKDEILFLYLNQIYLGHGAYGVEAATQKYFGKSVGDLNLAECAILAGLPQAPSRYSPHKDKEKSKQRQIYVLNRMLEEGYITKVQYEEALNTKIEIKTKQNLFQEVAPHFSEHIRRYVEKKYGTDLLYNSGINIYTTANYDMQIAAHEALKKGLYELDRRQGYRGPVKHLAPDEIEPVSNEIAKQTDEIPLEEGVSINGIVTSLDKKNNNVIVRIGNIFGVINFEDMKWARKPDPESEYYEQTIRHPGEAFKTGDLILVKTKQKIKVKGVKHKEFWTLSLDQKPKSESALLCLETGTGHVKAMVGGYDFTKNQFNRAIQAKRQPGSAFKPVIYAAAIDKGYTTSSIIIDSPIVFENSDPNLVWKPKNYKETFYGPTLLRDALAHSRNIVTIKILKDIGVDYAIDYARKLGITSELSRDLSIALGSSGVSLLELVRAYSVFANQGYLVQPVFIRKIVDRDGKILEEAKPSVTQVIEKSTAFIMTSLLESVVKYGTGQRILALNRPAVGKTGTTNDLYDAWFIGYTPELITGVWVGSDELASLGRSETGAVAASPIWLSFMQRALVNKPIRDFPAPEEGIEFAEIDAETGLLAIPESKKTILECYKEGTGPTRSTHKPGSITETADFFKSGM
jgi:penicillin-binding protein 1A